MRSQAGRVTCVGVGVTALLMVLAGCGAGQVSQTADQVTASGGAAGRAGAMLVRDLHFTWSDPVPGNAVYEVGDDATLQVTIVNDGSVLFPDGPAVDRLVAVSSPIATSGTVTGPTLIPDGQMLTAGYDLPVAGIALPPEDTVVITLVGLTTPIRAGLTYPVVFTFERAGELRIDDVPVENPDVLPPRARDEEPDEARTLETGPELVEAPR